MNVDEATQAAKEYNENFVRQHFPLPSVTYSQRVAITLLAEVERLRAELAEAKAASACPVKVVYFESDYELGVTVKLWTNADGQLFADWLRERIKKG